MQKIQEVLNMIASAKATKEYEKYFGKENVVDVAKKVYYAIDSLNKMPQNEAVASFLLAEIWIENNK